MVAVTLMGSSEHYGTALHSCTFWQITMLLNQAWWEPFNWLKCQAIALVPQPYNQAQVITAMVTVLLTEVKHRNSSTFNPVERIKRLLCEMMLFILISNNVTF